MEVVQVVHKGIFACVGNTDLRHMFRKKGSGSIYIAFTTDLERLPSFGFCTLDTEDIHSVEMEAVGNNFTTISLPGEKTNEALSTIRPRSGDVLQLSFHFKKNPDCVGIRLTYYRRDGKDMDKMFSSPLFVSPAPHMMRIVVVCQKWKFVILDQIGFDEMVIDESKTGHRLMFKCFICFDDLNFIGETTFRLVALKCGHIMCSTCHTKKEMNKCHSCPLTALETVYPLTFRDGPCPQDQCRTPGEDDRNGRLFPCGCVIYHLDKDNLPKYCPYPACGKAVQDAMRLYGLD